MPKGGARRAQIGLEIPTHRWITEKPMTGAAMDITSGVAGAEAIKIEIEYVDVRKQAVSAIRESLGLTPEP